jgi:capsular exopolysaccharide synthesis family protein
MDLRDYLRVVARRWRTIVGFTLAALAIAALVTVVMTPQYASTARLFVSTSPNNTDEAYQGSLFSAQRVTSYADLASGQALARRVIDRLELETTTFELIEKIDATVVPETVLLEITVTDADPRQAQRLTQAVAGELTELVSELETARGQSSAPIEATIVDPASLPLVPESPKPLLNLGLAGVLGLLLGIGAAVVRELLDTTIKDEDDATKVAGAAVMGTIPYDPSAAKNPLITAIGHHEPRAEAFRVLRTNLQFINVDHTSKVIVVTSSVADEGKSTTAANLAITLAQAEQRVLLIEADLRRPKFAEQLGIESVVGLTTALVGRISVEDAIQKDQSLPNLSVLASGTIPPNPSELLQSKAMSDVITRLRRRYDVILIDAPPLLPVTDAALLTSMADGALIVVRSGKTTRDQLRHSIERLDAVGSRALGLVLTMVHGRRGDDTTLGYGYPHELAGTAADGQEAEKPRPAVVKVSATDRR